MKRQYVGAAFLMAGRGVMLGLPMAAMLIPSAAQAQFSDSYNFLKAVRDRDGAKATTLVEKPGGTVVNTRDIKNGETALHIVTARRDLTWMSFLIGKGAKPDLTDAKGETPLMLATQLRWVEGAQFLLAAKANIEKANDNGETPLIRAVQLRDLAMIRLLVAEGANPDKKDAIAGMSARDYAEREGRSAGLTELLAAAKPAKPANSAVQGPTF